MHTDVLPVSLPASRGRRVAALAALACALSLAACGGSDYTAEQQRIANSTTPRGPAPPRTALPMPPVSSAHGAKDGLAATEGASNLGWTMLDGRRAHAADYKGKVLVLDFWATYCPPCREQAPHLSALQKRYGAEGLNVVGLNVGGEDDKPKVPGFVQELGVSYPLGYPDEAMSQLFFADNDAIPQTYVFDRRGRLVRRFIGYDRSMPAELEQAVQQALQQ